LETGNPVSNFSQKDPQPGEPARQKTEVRVAIDNEFIYVGAYLFDNSSDSIAKQILRNPEEILWEIFGLWLGAYNSPLT